LRQENLRAIYAMLVAVTMFSFMDTTMKVLSAHYPAMQVTALRALCSLPLLCGYMLYRGAFKGVFRIRWPVHLLRGSLGISMLTAFAFGLSTLSLAEAYSIFFIAPALITALSVFVLKEHVGRGQWCAIVVGLIGVLVVLRRGLHVGRRPGRAGRGGLLCAVGHRQPRAGAHGQQ
jgi:drug/metabolite transporter (DMT)-like permease